MKKVSLTIFLLTFVLLVQASEKMILLAEDGFIEYLKQDFHHLALRLFHKYDCKLTSIPEAGVQPVLRISTVKESGNYKSVLFAVQGNLFFVNEENPVEGLTSADLQQIFAGNLEKRMQLHRKRSHLQYAFIVVTQIINTAFTAFIYFYLISIYHFIV